MGKSRDSRGYDMSKGLNLGAGGINPQLGKYIEVPKAEKSKAEIVKQKTLPKDKQLVRSRKHRKVKRGPKLKPIVVTNDEQIKDLVRSIGEWIPYEEGEIPPWRNGNDDLFLLSAIFYFSERFSSHGRFKDVYLVNNSFSYLNKECNRLPYEYPRLRCTSYNVYMPLPEPYKPGHENSGWISCDRYLPKHKERVLVSTETEEIHITYYNEYAECFANNTKGEVIAWRPLPEPYED